MKKKLLSTFMAFASVTAFANNDLVLDGARWEAKAQGYKCGAFNEQVQGPLSHQELQVNFETLVTDRTLDNGLVKATFIQDGVTCSYSALLLADNTASTIGLVESKAYAIDGDADCSIGQNVLDASLADNDYLYWGHPHHVTIMMPAASASVVCGEGATHVGLDFVVSKFLGER
ncbi:MAG: hypothetical protein KC478_08200 [Bacteriovoracaceae bacterium]|nr:hypothetical protein [Bacteriovoracaceae bacterium]